MHVLDERCLPTVYIQINSEISRFFFFIWFEENLKYDRHIPSMEYFMQNANKTSKNNVGFVDSISDYTVYSSYTLQSTTYLPIVMPIVWLLMTFFFCFCFCCGLKINWTFYSSDNEPLCFIHFYWYTQSIENAQNVRNNLRSTWNNTTRKDHFSKRKKKPTIDLIWKIMASPKVIERMWPPIYWYE